MSRVLPQLAALGLMATAAPGFASDWPHWRGPDRNGITSESGWTVHWPAAGPSQAWKAQVGLGFSSFAVAQGRAVTVGHADEKDTLFCFDAATGKTLWTHAYASELGDKYFEGGTTGSPTFDGDRLFWLSRWGDLFCLNAVDGKVVWKKALQTEIQARIPDWGLTGAPLVLGDRLILNVGDAGLAMDKKTGAILWQSAAKNAGYSTPLPFKQNDDQFVAMGSEKSYVAVNLKDGKELWRIKWLTQYGVNAADPILVGNQVFLSSGYGKGAGLFEVGGAEPKELWKSKALRTQLNGAVLYKGYLYGVDGDTSEKASLKCVEFTTGEVKWSEANFGSGGVIIADGKLIALSGGGELMVAPVSTQGFKPSARAQVLGGKCWTAPVLANGLIYTRNSRGDVAVVSVRKP